MKTRPCFWLPLTGLLVALLAGRAAAADAPAPAPASESGAAGWADLLRVVGQLPIPSLTGLIQPEKMGLLTDNETDMNLLSGNETNVLSGIHILSDLSIDVHITIGTGDHQATPGKAKRDAERRRAPKARKHKARAKAKPPQAAAPSPAP